MKHKGCTSDFTSQRNRELMAAYRKAVTNTAFIDISEVSAIVADSPCSRFWVSVERATIVVSAIEQGRDVLSFMRPLGREMFEEIYQRYLRLRERDSHSRTFDLVMLAVYSPAPKFYMQPRCAMEVIYKMKKGWYERRGK